MESVYRFEDSGHEIVPIEIFSLYINRRSVTQNFNFRNVKMYGTVFNYIGYMAKIQMNKIRERDLLN